MWHDVVDLRDFYEAPLGQMARGTIGQSLCRFWPSVRGQRLLGLGYATPYLKPFQDMGAVTLAAMPAPQGVMAWPRGGGNLACLAEEAALPFADESFDRVLAIHALEHVEALRPWLREIWRLLKGDGRVIFVVPGRRGFWARSDKTPFGWGRPFSAAQLQRLLSEQLFTPLTLDRALYLPPTERRWLLKSAAPWERFGKRWLYRAGGVHLIEAKKELYAPSSGSLVKARRRVVVTA